MGFRWRGRALKAGAAAAGDFLLRRRLRRENMARERSFRSESWFRASIYWACRLARIRPRRAGRGGKSRRGAFPGSDGVAGKSAEISGKDSREHSQADGLDASH